jgi:hypothetical protein
MTTKELHARASAMLERYRSRIHNIDRVNRAAGRAERIITRHAARNGELLPTLYVSSCGRWLTTWPGQKVAVLQTTGKARGFHGVKLTCYSATIEGRNYFGRGLGPGMYINLRPGKVVAR